MERILSQLLLVSALMFFLGNTPVLAQTVSEIRVLDDEKKGIKSQIFAIEADNKEIFIRDTDANGLVKPNYKCKEGQRVKAKPEDLSYYHSRPTACQATVTLKVSSRSAVSNLLKHGKIFVYQKDYGIAALIFNEINARTIGSDETLALEAEKNSYIYAGKQLDVSDPVLFDESQNKFVMSRQLSTKLKVFQSQNDIRENGQLDFSTLKALSKGASITKFTMSPPK